MLKFALVAGALMVASTGLSAQEASLRCPAPGSKVERTNLPTITYRGADPASPLICLDQARQPRFLGYWSTQSAFFNAGGKQLLSTFAEWKGGPSRVVNIDYFGSDRYGNSTTVNEKWQILGQEQADVRAGSFDAIKVRRAYSVVGTSYTFTETLWIDRASGMPVKSVVDHLNATMSPDVTSWQATEVITRSSGS
ncbi:hypothetical protein [Roseomonas sp. KE0001]|uniref:hypothetical protein n=1 Tax=Roseomonas sp. KE0001 TaxID=2479201 RepID=UPI0018DFAA1C|nr:hypothetical protein [Roseomonas sp. KE0001]